MRRAPKIFLMLIALLTFSSLGIRPSLAEEELSIVHAVMFYSQTCPHCHKVINEDLPPLVEQYGDQLLIIGIDTQSEEGSQLYQAMTIYFQLPDNRLGVPALVVGETVMIGSQEIPALFPGIISKGLQDGGIPWPAIPGLAELITSSIVQATAQAAHSQEVEAISESTSTNEPLDQAAPTAQPIAQNNAPTEPIVIQDELQAIAFENRSISEIFMVDPTGNTLSVIVLAAMILSVFAVGYRITRSTPTTFSWPIWTIPTLSVIGLIVAGYMSYIEVTGSKAICGPVGDCNTVQQSPYALLFGLVPIGVVGLLGYIAFIFTWIIQSYGPHRWQKLAKQAIWGMAFFGTLFSIYLTFLEPFVIGATCAWCLTSAILITAILWAATSPFQDT